MTEINLDYLNELSGGDNDFVIEMLKTYLEETSKDIDEIKRSFVEGNLQRISFLAHRCKAAFRMLGLDNMTDTAEHIEKEAKVETAVIGDFKLAIEQLTKGASSSFEQAREWIKRLEV